MIRKFILLTLSSIAIFLHGADRSLPAEAQRESDRLQALRDWAASVPAGYIRNVNTGQEMLQDLTVLENTPVNGEKIVRFTPKQISLLNFFVGYVMKLEGELKLTVSHDGVHWKEPGHWWVSADGMQARYIGDSTMVKFAGKGVIHCLRIRSREGMSMEFDAEPYQVPAETLPILNVKIAVAPETKMEFNGDSAFNRRKWMRLYNMPDSDGGGDYIQASEYFVPRGFAGARDAGFKLTPITEQALPPDIPTLKRLEKYYPEPPASVMCFEKMPEQVQCRDSGLANFRTTPDPEKFRETASLMAAAVARREQRFGKYAGFYCEVKNESDIGTNWAFFNDRSGKNDPWKLLADFHNDVASAVKTRNPKWKVGGPASCLPVFDANGFERGRAMLRFAERTYAGLDYYSWHLYEANRFRLRRPGEHQHRFLSGRLDATIDLYRNHLRLLGGEKPLLITEFGGTSGGGGTQVNYWKNLRSVNSLLVGMMNYPDIIEMAVPFIVPVPWWDKKNPVPCNFDIYYLFTYDKAGKMHLTPNRYFLDFWEGVDGIRVPVYADNPDVHVVALRNGRQLTLIVNNLSGHRITADISVEPGDSGWKSITQRRLYIEHGELIFRTDKLNTLSRVPLAFEETSLIRLELNRDPDFTGVLDRRILYGDRILLPTGTPQTFRLMGGPSAGDIRRCTLRVGCWRMNGFRRDGSVQFNGKRFILPLAKTAGNGSFFAPVELEIPASLLKRENLVTVDVPEIDGLLTSVGLYYDTFKGL